MCSPTQLGKVCLSSGISLAFVVGRNVMQMEQEKECISVVDLFQCHIMQLAKCGGQTLSCVDVRLHF